MVTEDATFEVGPPDVSVAHFCDVRPAGGFRVVYADPPWLFKMRSARGYAKSASMHYKCMPTDDLCEMPVEALAAPDAYLFLWATFPMLNDALRVLRAWGFTYVTGAAWAKESKLSGDIPTDAPGHCFAFGTGYIFRDAAELLLVGKRGSPHIKKNRQARAVRNLIYAPLREHSRKPGTFTRSMIEMLCTGPYVELFARASAENWVAIGNQVGKFGD